MITSKFIFLEDHRDFLEYVRGSGPTVEIRDIQVGTERRLGRGRALVDQLLKRLPSEFPDCKVVWAITRAENKVAQQFYESLHFRIIGNLFDFYRDVGPEGRVDAVMYGRNV